MDRRFGESGAPPQDRCGLPFTPVPRYGGVVRANYTLPRLYLDAPLHGEIALSREHSHYLGAVLRRRIGDPVRLFNARDGEVRAEVQSAERKAMTVRVVEQTREPVAAPDIRLLFAPLRKHRTATVLEKATELGARTIQPVLTARTQFTKINAERAAAQIIEAAEQTERLDLPEYADPLPLMRALDPDRPLLFADEAGAARGVDDALQGQGLPVDILVGPEGGFTDEERDALRRRDHVQAVSLGPRILRADTAAIAMLALVQSAIGDWSASL